MTFSVRLNTDIWVSAEIRRCDTLFISAVVLHKGDAERGLVLIKQYVHAKGCKIYTQTRDFDDNLNWHQPLGEEWIEEAKADAYVVKQRTFDEDLWVLEIEDAKGAYKPEI